MKIYAAIDLRDGAAVQLVGGDPSDERVRLPDPAGVARRWLDAGFRHLHVVDLDAALGSGSNQAAIRSVAEALSGRATLQVGGGLRDAEAVRRVLDGGADRAVVGSRAVEDRPWLEATAAEHPGRLVVAADVRDGAVATRGWRETTSQEAGGFVRSLDEVPLGAVLVTDVGREGRQEGVDGSRFEALAQASRHPLIAAGGVTTAEDLAALDRAGVAGVVLGMALYTGRLEPAVALEFEDGTEEEGTS